jgi:hypothetical protein
VTISSVNHAKEREDQLGLENIDGKAVWLLHTSIMEGKKFRDEARIGIKHLEGRINDERRKGILIPCQIICRNFIETLCIRLIIDLISAAVFLSI